VTAVRLAEGGVTVELVDLNLVPGCQLVYYGHEITPTCHYNKPFARMFYV